MLLHLSIFRIIFAAKSLTLLIMKNLKLRMMMGAFLALMVMSGKAQKWEHLADTPQMGWSTWNKFQGNISEEVIKGIADAMVESGLRDAGYTYINIDDCWHGKRDADGFIQADPVKFPNGMKAVADYVHSKGLKLGIYSDAGTGTCAGMPGSLGHEYQDAIQYARWGVDYLKYDWCNTTNVNPQGAYQLISDALRANGRPIFLSMCEWGNSRPWKWAKEIGHSWRTTPDIW
jgi:alpha-galactosidase